MEIAVLLFDDLTVLDAAGPAEVLGRLPGAKVKFVATTQGPIRSQGNSSGLSLIADHTLAQVTAPDIVLVPGGPGYVAAGGNRETVDWLYRVHETSTWTTSVCTGSLVLGAAGLLKGVRATTHWSMMGELPAFGAVAVDERVVRDGKVMTGAGVSAGIDMALHLAALVAGKEEACSIQKQIEYDPQPPFAYQRARQADQ